MSTIIAGCGFGGAVVARQLAEANEKVRIIERRNHIGETAMMKWMLMEFWYIRMDHIYFIQR